MARKNRRQAQVRVGGGWMAHCVRYGGCPIGTNMSLHTPPPNQYYKPFVDSYLWIFSGLGRKKRV